jgi:hypothetical protein
MASVPKCTQHFEFARIGLGYGQCELSHFASQSRPTRPADGLRSSVQMAERSDCSHPRDECNFTVQTIAQLESLGRLSAAKPGTAEMSS